MPAIYEHHHTVADAEIDALGHASNLAYVAWMQDAAIAHSAAQGWPGEAYRQLGQGWVVRSHEITYLRPAFVGEPVVVRTWVATLRKASSLRRYEVLRPADGKTLATAATDWAFVDYGSGLPARIPPQVSQAFVLAPDVE